MNIFYTKLYLQNMDSHHTYSDNNHYDNLIQDSHNIIPHYQDCDTHYNHSPIENTVCNVSEHYHFMDDVRECLQDLQDQGIGFIDRHESCFSDHFGF